MLLLVELQKNSVIPIARIFLLSQPARFCYYPCTMASVANSDFIVWGVDRSLYGPVELPTLVSWALNHTDEATVTSG